MSTDHRDVPIPKSLISDDFADVPAPSRTAGGKQITDPFDPWVRMLSGSGPTAQTRRMVRDMNGVDTTKRPAVFDEIADYQRWVDAGQPPEPKIVTAWTPELVGRACDDIARNIGDSFGAIAAALAATVEQIAASVAGLVPKFRADFDRIARLAPDVPQPGDSRAELARKVAAVQQARGNSTGPQQRQRAPKTINPSGGRP